MNVVFVKAFFDSLLRGGCREFFYPNPHTFADLFFYASFSCTCSYAANARIMVMAVAFPFLFNALKLSINSFSIGLNGLHGT